MPEEYISPPQIPGDENNNETKSTPYEKPDSVQSPPPPPITIRTMESDKKSMQSSGGTPIPQQVKPDELKLPVSGEEEPPFSPSSTLPEPETTEKEGLPKWIKTTGIIAGAIVIFGGFAWLGYYYVYPLIFPPQPELPAPLQETTTQPIETETAETSEQPAQITHQSLFVSAPTQTESLLIASVDAGSIQEALVAAATQTLTSGSIKEIAFETDGRPMKSSEFLPALLPVLTDEEILANFKDDFTSYVYYDDNGTWPGFIFKMQDDAVLFEAQNIAKKIETAQITSLKNLFISDPQDKNSETFADGQLKETATRYLPFKTTGASLNYGIINNYLLISTSYAGIQKAVELLRL